MGGRSGEWTYDTAVIGGGVGGLATGCYLQMNGFRSCVLERCANLGGVCVAWERGGFLFDGATNWLPGSSARVPDVHHVLAELIDFTSLSVWDFDEFVQIEEKGQVFHVYTDADRLEEEMMRLGPSDGAAIRKFTNGVRLFGRLAIPFDQATDLARPLDLVSFPLRHPALVAFYHKWKRLSIRQYAQRFSSPVLRSMFQQILLSHEGFSVLSLLAVLGWMNAQGAGYPYGGSVQFVERLQQKYESLGGKIMLKKEVRKILTQENRVTGVECHDETRINARYVISAADRLHTVLSLLEGRYMDRGTMQYLDECPVYPALVQVSLGVKGTFGQEPHKLVLPLSRELPMGRERVSKMLVRICNFDDLYAPAGKTSLVVHLRTSDPLYWRRLRENDREGYRRAKEASLEQVVQSLVARLGFSASDIEVTDVATPATYIRYNNLWQGSYQGWAPTGHFIGRSLPRQVPGLKNFYFAGQWLSPGGGLPRAILSGRQVTQRVCRDEGRSFRTQ
jgi:phytoene dehydrogenase-like protein